MPQAFPKDPDATLDYTINWSGTPLGPWLQTGEELATTTWIVPSGITKDTDTKTTTAATIWLSGGTAGQEYQIICRITTNSTPVRKDDRTIAIFMTER